jgi:competence protein ComEC
MIGLQAPLVDTATTDVSAPDGPDLRLAGFVVGAWLAVLITMPMPARCTLAVAIAAVLCAVLLAHAARRLEGRLAGSALVAASLLLGAASGAVATASHVGARDNATIRQLIAAEATVRAELTVTADPRLSRTSTPGRPIWVVAATATRLTATSPALTIGLHAPVLLLGLDNAWQGLLPGQQLGASGRLAAPRERDLTVAVLTARDAPTLLGRPPWYQRVAGRLRAGLQAACHGLPRAPAGLLPGLVDGDTSALDPRVRRDFEASGMTYLVVVAGLHLAIALGFVLAVVRWSRAGPRLRAGIGLLALGGFVVLARPGPSVARAGVMAALGLIAAGVGRPRAALPALFTSVYVLLVLNPQFAVQAGFALSSLATFGLLTLVPAWRERLRRRGLGAGPATAVSVSLAAQLVCAPVIAATWGVVGVSAVPANIVAEPLLAPAMVLGLAAMFVAPISPGAAHALAWLAAWPCRWLAVVAHYAARLPAGVLPWPTGLAGGVALAALLLVALAGWTYRPYLVAVLVTAALGVLAVAGVSAVPVTGTRVAVSAAPPSRASPCHARRGPLPDPRCTPGALNPAVTQATIAATICNAGWSETVRPPSTYTDALKRQQIEQYGYLGTAVGDYEEDHLVPLSLGGAPSDPRNLWPEPGASPNVKDRVEWDLQAAVCSHEVRLSDAQRAIAADWTTAERRLGL